MASPSRDMVNDPFFVGHREHMRMMNDMFPPMGFGHPMLGAPERDRRSNAVQPFIQNAMSPFDMFGNFDNMFGNMHRMMNNMHQQFEQVSNNPNGNTFSQSSVYSYTSTGAGAPKVYQASSSTRTAPGGIKETRKSMRDSERGIEKMAVGHHIKERAHIVEKSKNRQGDIDENQELINLDENETAEFDREWKDKTRSAVRLEYRRRGERSDRRGEQRALPEPRRDRSYRDRERQERDY